MKAVLCLLFSLPGGALAESPRVAEMIARADAEERQHRTRPALTALRAAERLEPENVGILLRISKQYSDLIGQTEPREAAKAVAERSLDYAKRAAALAPSNAKARLSLAVAYGKLTDFVGNRTRLEYSKIVKEEALKAIQLDPSDDFAWHVLGRWHCGVANVGGTTRTMAKLIYGGLPAASNEEAVRHFQRAVEIAPRRIIHHRELARVYISMGKLESARRCWQTIVQLPSGDGEDAKAKQEAAQELAKPEKRENSKAPAEPER